MNAAIRGASKQPATLATPVDRHPPAGAGRAAVRRPARRSSPSTEQRRDRRLRQQAELRSEPVRRGSTSRTGAPSKIARRPLLSRRCAARIRPARPASRSWRWRSPSATDAAAHDLRPGPTTGNHRFRDDGSHNTVTCKSIVQSCDTYYYTLASDLSVDAMHFMAPASVASPASTRRAARLLPSIEWKRTATRRRKRRSGMSGRSRSASARLQQLHDAAAGAGRAAVAAGGHASRHLVRAVENPDARLDPLAFPALPALDWKPEHVAVIRNALYGVTQEGTSALNQRALQVGRRPAPRR